MNTEFDFIHDMLAQAEIAVETILSRHPWEDQDPDLRTDLRVLLHQIGGSMDLTRRLIAEERVEMKAQGGKAVLRMAERQQREIAGQPPLKILDD